MSAIQEGCQYIENVELKCRDIYRLSEVEAEGGTALVIT